MLNDYFFARIYDPVVDPYIKKLRLQVLDLANKYRPANVLDVCCGTGHQLKILGKHGFRVTGIDLSDQMIKVSEKGQQNVNCVKGDATNMPFDDDSFEMVMITLALHENTAETAKKILNEMFRVVTPEGKIILVDYELSDKTRRDARFVTKTVEWMVGGDHYRNFRKYLDFGGLPHLLKDMKYNAIEEFRYAGHSLAILVIEKHK